MQPEGGYARLGDSRIAYQVIGDGPVDVVLGPGTWGSMDMEWERPEWALFYRRWAAFCRVIRYDPRGSGSSDPRPGGAPAQMETSVEEMLAVMDACGSERAVPLGFLDGGHSAMLFAASVPERTSGLILNHTAARYVQGDG
jgi:pimeloyl-ACP methyl ester carboxylesterase